jgi:dihydroorotate dehydrogenase
MLFISPPFGNYINLPKTRSIKGSFTLEPRSGLIMQIIKTLRYDFRNKGWVNKIGLRNRGIDWAIKKYKFDTDSIVSIAIMDYKEIDILNKKIPNNMDLELNISCPNVKNNLIHDDLYKFLNNERNWCNIKLSPITDMELVDKYYNQGFRHFHCCNTLPTLNGGLSGIAIQKYSFDLITKIRNKYPDTIIIGGGGITNITDIKKYKYSGANYFSVSSIMFNPILFGIFYYNYTLYKKYI